MEQRAMILRAWGREHIHRAPPPAGARASSAPAAVQHPAAASDTAESFASFLRENTDTCWEEVVPEFRANYYDALEELIPPLLAIDDPLITLNLVRFADPSNPREVKLLRQLISQCDPERHQHSLRALAQMGAPELLTELKQKKGMPADVREVLNPARPSPLLRKVRKRGSTDV
jgi:hypothetical protein